MMGDHANRTVVCNSDAAWSRAPAEPIGVCVIDLDQPDGCDADLWLLCTGPKAILPLIRTLAPRILWVSLGYVERGQLSDLEVIEAVNQDDLVSIQFGEKARMCHFPIPEMLYGK